MTPNFNPNDPRPEDLPGFRWPDQSNFGREMRRWNKPYKFEAYPAMVYRAHQTTNGAWATALQAPSHHGFRDDQEWNRAVVEAERFTTSCQRTVADEHEHARARDEGWRDSPVEAMEFREALEKAVSTAAAERAHSDRRMGAKAQAEAKATDDAFYEHLGEIPAQPVRRRVARKAKKRSAAKAAPSAA